MTATSIRDVTEQYNIKFILTTALVNTQNVFGSFETGCEAYAAKPIDTEKLVEVMKKLKLIV